MKEERSAEKKNIYEIIQEQLLKKIEGAMQSDQPFYWVKPWQSAPYPCSYSNPKKAYSAAVNFLFLDPGEHLTFSLFRKLKETNPTIRIRKGAKQVYVYQCYPVFQTNEKGEPILDVDGTAQIENFRVRYTREFHISDIENLKSHFIKEHVHERTEQTALADCLIHSYAQKYEINLEEKYGISRAYSQGRRVVLPDRRQYESVYEYYSTVFHELAHSTSQIKGTQRKGISYAQEELVAEITSSFLCASLHLQDDRSLQNNLAYLKGWYRTIKDAQPKDIYFATAQARQAAHQILSSSPRIVKQLQDEFTLKEPDQIKKNEREIQWGKAR